ncbi:MAG TPA: ATP-binding protein [Phototrophicaceae bacterium]|jgi:signal transduction histidine kinase|nr:ATP-binding protein [Phototrophicaceae bacterium]
MSTPSNIDFATEVKSDRLNLLWKVTLVGSGAILMFSLTLLSLGKVMTSLWIAMPFVLIGTSLFTRSLLKRGLFEQAAWSFTIGAIVAIAVAMTGGVEDEIIFRATPFMLVVVVFIGGLLLRPAAMFIIAGLAIGVTLVVPFVVTGSTAFFSGYQIFAIVAMLLAAGLAAQVTGELYAVTEWALLNYQRERRTNSELFDNRQKLELTLKRSEALGERLQHTNEELETARTTAEAAKNFRGQFLANMSHELRTPLNAIIGFSETMLKFPIMYDGVELADAYRADLNQIFNSGKQLLILINDILDLSKVDAGKLEIRNEEVDLMPIIRSTLEMAEGLIGTKTIVLRTELPRRMPRILADNNRVRQVLTNLYSNAVKFTEQGEIVLSVYTFEREVKIAVRDTGSGIPKESLEIIFEEFRQADNSRRDPRAGAGLGLAISRQLMNLMSGHIWAESEPGQGSVFYMTLPIYPSDEALSLPEPEIESEKQEIN